MATDIDWPTPEENAEILRGSANRRANHDQDDRGYREDMRDIWLATTRRRLVFLGIGETPDIIRRAPRPMAVAFTDEEAAHAWVACRHPADETPMRWSVFPPDEPLTGRRPGRRWAKWIADAGGEVLVVNPAGPSTYASALGPLDAPPRLRSRTIPGDAEPWLDLGLRAAARARDAEVDAALRDVLARDDIAGFDDLEEAMATCNKIGSMLGGSLHRFVQGWWSLRHGYLGRGAIHLLDGAEGYARFGDGAGAVDAYLRSAELLRPLWSDATELSSNDAEVMRLQALRLRHDLGLVGGDRRQGEIAAVLDWLPEVRTGETR